MLSCTITDKAANRHSMLSSLLMKTCTPNNKDKNRAKRDIRAECWHRPGLRGWWGIALLRR